MSQQGHLPRALKVTSQSLWQHTPEAREVSGSGLRHVETVEADGPSGRKLA